MLLHFQQALADLVAAPDLCRKIRATPAHLNELYDLSPREYSRLVKMVNQKAMACNCMLYRANRLAPIAMNLPDTCRKLGPRLGPLLTDYATLHPNTNVHFYLECDRFCNFLQDKVDPETKQTLAKEHATIKLGLKASYTAL
jgi:hypothetical protein